MESKSLIQPSETLTIKLIKTHKTLLIKLTESFSLELFDLKEKWYSLVAVWFWVGFHFFNHWLIFKPYESHFQGKTCEEIFFQKRLTNIFNIGFDYSTAAFLGKFSKSTLTLLPIFLFLKNYV